MSADGDLMERSRLRLPTQANASLILGIVAGVVLLYWSGSNGYRDSLLVLGCSYGLFALGMYIPFVLAGTLSMAYSAYGAIGGYGVAILGQKYGLPLWVGWFVGPPVAAVLALFLGSFTRRLSGFYLVAVTLLFAQAFQVWAGSASIAGGDGGFDNLPPLSLFGWNPTQVQFDIIAVVLVIVMTFIVDRLRISRWGITVRAMREVPHAVEATGIRVPTLQLVALAIGAAVGALGGSLFITSVKSITPLTFTLDLVFTAVFMPIVGGIGTAWGAIIGAGVVADLTLNITVFGQSGTILVALGVLIILLVAPSGVAGYLDSGRKWITKFVDRRLSHR